MCAVCGTCEIGGYIYQKRTQFHSDIYMMSLITECREGLNANLSDREDIDSVIEVYFNKQISLQLRLSEQPDYLKNHKADKTFYKDYRKKLHANLGMDDSFSSECSEKSPKKIHQVSQTGDNPTKITIKTVGEGYTVKAVSAAANSGGVVDGGASSSASGSQVRLTFYST